MGTKTESTSSSHHELSRRLRVTGMHCGSCVGQVEKLLTAQPGVSAASVNLATGEARVSVDSALVQSSVLAEALTAAGYATEAMESGQPTRGERELASVSASAKQFNLTVAILLTVPVFVMEMGSHFSATFASWLADWIGQPAIHWMQLLLSAVVLFYAGREFFLIGIPALIRRAPEMNSLVALGGSAAWLYSAIATVFPDWLPEDARHVYFEAAAVIVTLILLGRYLEARARKRTNAAIDALADLQPASALVKRNGQLVELPIEEVTTSDQLQVRPGERIPVDGTIISGSGRIDESMLTGESAAPGKHAGDRVFAGTINVSGSLLMQVTAIGDDTALAAIINQVWEAQNSKLPIQALVDKIAMWFVPGVMLIAALTFVFWIAMTPSGTGLQQAVVHAIAVLIVACPCAMGLATPLSVMVGTGRAAREGILFRHGDALQHLGEAKVIAFDKTGTLTQGRTEVTNITTHGALDANALLRLVAAVQQHSEHPLATAVKTAARTQRLDDRTATQFESVAGMGVHAQVDGHRVAAGNTRLMQLLDIDMSMVNADLSATTRLGQTVFNIAVDGQWAGLITVSDTVRPEAGEMLESLKSLGIKVVMISGDQTETAMAIGESLGIKTVLGDVLPAEKREAVRKLRRQYGAVAFVGDGINDAPALAEADVGIAIGSGTDVAIEAADLVLAGNNLNAVTRAIEVSRSAMRNIWQNLFWAFLYNLLLIPVAAGVLSFAGIHLSPMLAAAAMSLSSLFVVFNALRLNQTPAVSLTSRPETNPLASAI